MNKEEFIEKYHSRIFYSEEAKRNPLARFGISCSDGWMDIVSKCAEEIVANDPEERVKFFQIKEKFGGLRFYTDIEDYDNEKDKDFYQLISSITMKAEIEASKTCELCGVAGTKKNTNRSYIRTLCFDCSRDMNK